MRTSGRLALAFLFCVLLLVLFAQPLHAGRIWTQDGSGPCARVPEGIFAPALPHFGSIKAVDFASASPCKSQFLPPRYELATPVFAERRGRSGGMPGLPWAHQNLCSDADRRALREAKRAFRSALLFAMWAYDRRFVNDVTEGGKDVVREVSNIQDWADAIPSVATD